MRFLIISILIFGYTVLNAQNDDPVLFTVGDENIHLSEFTYIYEKNNAKNADYSEDSLKDYLELYKKFKLKVLKAREFGLDTVKTLQQELEGYRKQLAKSYLKDKQITERLIDEVIDRMQYDIEVSHIFAGAEPKSSSEKEARARQKINDIYTKLQEGAPFDMMASTLSEDKMSSIKDGYLGYYSAPLPNGFYKFETAMYETPVGEISEPVRSKMGFHILKISDKRPARGEMEIAHILFRKKGGGRTTASAHALADSVYNLLKEGRNFENMAAKFSNDSNTKHKGGYLGYFGVNQYERAFEDAAFALQENGDYTKPVATNLGFHIIKRINKRDNANKVALRKRVKARITKDERFKIAEDHMIERIKQSSGFEENRFALKRFISGLDDSFFSYKWQTPAYEEDIHLFSMAGQNYTLNDFAQYAKDNVRDRLRFNQVKSTEDAVDELYDKFVDEKIMAYEEKNLENKYPDFKALMREYREGILLFEITKREVWDKAAEDTTGLNRFYEMNMNKYMWPERVNAVRYTLSGGNDQGLISIYKYAQKKGHEKMMSKFGDNKAYNITAEKLVMDKGDKAISEMTLKPGGLSPLNLSPSSPATFYAFESLVKPTRKSLKEARGYVIADYQDHLEKRWITELEAQYPYRLNNKVLKSIIKKQ